MSTVIKFKRLVSSPQYGNCGPGDILRCSEAFARHCVQDLSAAEYVLPAKPADIEKPPEKPKRARRAART